MATMDAATARTIGELVEGQRQIEGQIDKMEAKVDRLFFLGMGILGAVIAATVSSTSHHTPSKGSSRVCQWRGARIVRLWQGPWAS